MRFIPYPGTEAKRFLVFHTLSRNIVSLLECLWRVPVLTWVLKTNWTERHREDGITVPGHPSNEKLWVQGDEWLPETSDLILSFRISPLKSTRKGVRLGVEGSGIRDGPYWRWVSVTSSYKTHTHTHTKGSFQVSLYRDWIRGDRFCNLIRLWSRKKGPDPETHNTHSEIVK